MAIFNATAGTAFRAEILGLDVAGAFPSTDLHSTQVFTDTDNNTQLHMLSYTSVTFVTRANIISFVPITLDHSTFDDTFVTPNYSNSALHTYTGVTSDFTFYDIAQGSGPIGILTGAVYDIAVRDSYSRVFTETQEIVHSSTVESFTGLFMGNDRVFLSGLADYFCDPQGDLQLHLGGGDDLGIHMVGAADDAVVMWGEAGNDQLQSQGGNASLYGGAGADTLSSYGDGANQFYGGAGADVVYAHRGVIYDGAASGADNYSGDGSGQLLLTYETATRGITADLWNGFARGRDIGDDLVVGIRQLHGSQGNDVLIGNPVGMLSEFGVTLWGDTGNDSIAGTSQGDLLFGGAGNDKMSGGTGADTLMGGAGRDVLAGDGGFGVGGADVFYFGALSDSAAATPDRITDFVQGDDVIDLRRIDARGGGPDNAFVFIGSAGFTAAGQLRMFQQGGTTVIEANTTGASGAEMTVVLTGNWALTAADFVL